MNCCRWAALIVYLFALAIIGQQQRVWRHAYVRRVGVQVAMVLFGVSLVVAGAVFVIGEYVVPRAEQLVCVSRVCRRSPLRRTRL